MLKKLSDKALGAWVRLRYGDRGDFVQQGLLWGLIVVIAIAVISAIGVKVLGKFESINNAL